MNNSNSASLLVMETTAFPTTVQRPRPLLGTITSLASLREHLQWAIELEHATIPPYLCALYSINTGHNAEAREVLSSVMVEEMLHLTLAANLLNAVGGRPELDIPGMLPSYPHPLPHGDPSFEISLFRFGPEAIETFLKIEQPSPPGGPPEGENYETIAQFYEAIKLGLRELSATLGETNVFAVTRPGRSPTNIFTAAGGASLRLRILLLHWLRWMKSANRAKAPALSRSGMATVMCSIPSAKKSPIITAFRN